jgi:hypothetical protein
LSLGVCRQLYLRAVSDWIRLNETVLIDYWEERIFTDELLGDCSGCHD